MLRRKNIDAIMKTYSTRAREILQERAGHQWKLARVNPPHPSSPRPPGLSSAAIHAPSSVMPLWPVSCNTPWCAEPQLPHLHNSWRQEALSILYQMSSPSTAPLLPCPVLPVLYSPARRWPMLHRQFIAPNLGARSQKSWLKKEYVRLGYGAFSYL